MARQGTCGKKSGRAMGARALMDGEWDAALCSLWLLAVDSVGYQKQTKTKSRIKYEFEIL